MALADILDAVQREGDEEVARIVAARDDAVAAIGRKARGDARRVEALATTSRDAALAAEAGVIRHRAVLHVERRLQEAREAVFQEILGRARDRLSRHRGEPSYPATVTALLAECASFLGHVEVVEADPRDAGDVRGALDRLEIAPALELTIECWGGVVASDGKGVFVRNTLEDRIGRAEGDLRRKIGELVPGLRSGAAPS